MVTHNVREAVAACRPARSILSPRPAHVIGVVEIAPAREERRGAALDALVADLAARFPSLASL